MLRALLLVPVLLLLPVVPAEGPVDGDCDDSGKLVCAGANVGARVECRMETATQARCAYTWGDVWTAYSPVGLPGNATGDVDVLVTTCAPLCGNAESTTPLGCAFVGLDACDGGAGHEGATPLVTLGMGQCLSVTITQRATVTATVVRGVARLASATWTDVDQAAGSVCLVDDGR